MAKQTLLKLEHGDIEYNDDGETKVYTYKGKPFDQLTDDEKAEVRDDPTMKSFVGASVLLAEAIGKIFEEVKNVVVPIMNQVSEIVKKAEAEAEAAKKKAAKKKPAKKVKNNETKWSRTKAWIRAQEYNRA